MLATEDGFYWNRSTIKPSGYAQHKWHEFGFHVYPSLWLDIIGYKTLESKSPQTSLLVTSVTIIELTSLDTGRTLLNPTPQNRRFCRTLRMSMEKESSDAIRNEFDCVEKGKTSLVPYDSKPRAIQM
ncbi:hypothetical protein QAD02_003560 [Eretmocerus hayati]|uniref:Uncharacterized protein n=1 Tax=Eretmocerus hayati TaxID=131215 RepID=A0ACC2NN14_9HYME|nr:hypothetical protein QAD02_003560 [Eretmocerus hayati]